MLPSTGRSLGFATKQYSCTRCSPSTVGFGVKARAPRAITTRGLAFGTGSPSTVNCASRRGSILTPRSCGLGRLPTGTSPALGFRIALTTRLVTPRLELGYDEDLAAHGARLHGVQPALRLVRQVALGKRQRRTTGRLPRARWSARVGGRQRPVGATARRRGQKGRSHRTDGHIVPRRRRLCPNPGTDRARRHPGTRTNACTFVGVPRGTGPGSGPQRSAWHPGTSTGRWSTRATRRG